MVPYYLPYFPLVPFLGLIILITSSHVIPSSIALNTQLNNDRTRSMHRFAEYEGVVRQVALQRGARLVMNRFIGSCVSKTERVSAFRPIRHTDLDRMPLERRTQAKKTTTDLV